MRVVLETLLAASICLQTAQGLMCYTCDAATTSSECNRETNCTAISPKLSVCQTTILSPEVGFPFHGSETVVRQCVQRCSPTQPESLGVTKKILCCNLDLCNHNGIGADSSDPCSSSSGTSASSAIMTPSLPLLAAMTATFLLH